MNSATARRTRDVTATLDQYLHDIGAYPLLDRGKEAVLAGRIRAGDPGALEELVSSNLRFVVSVAKRYQHQGVSILDLINEGNIGLMRAARKFDESRGIKFISYAVWWVRQAIQQALADQSRIVRVPVTRAMTIQRIGKCSSALTQALGREPTANEIAAELDMPPGELERNLAVGRGHLSLNAPVAPGESGQLLDVIPDQLSPGPDEQLYTRALSRSIEAVLATLSEREASVLRLYFGLGEAEPMTLEQIGEQFGVTRERVRQIKEQALLRLRQESRARLLDGFR